MNKVEFMSSELSGLLFLFVIVLGFFKLIIIFLKVINYDNKNIFPPFNIIVIFVTFYLPFNLLHATNEKQWTSTKINKISDQAIYNEIRTKGIIKVVKEFVDGTNKTVKRNGGQIKVDEITTQQYSIANNNVAVQRFQINKNALLNFYPGVNLKEIISYVKKSVNEYNVNAFCSINAYKILLEKGMVLDFMYQFDDGNFVMSYTIEYKNCNK